ncbi:immunoglobulin-like domain-containing protein [Dubosiella newyorkensis]|uniref:immunoglobulin-like domain-containing protein n=1 Tax=Dubosiella newyorkensis TaxID=1862672 RepID=UPI00272D60A3|nr:immunoglobulin-like domain-containing protein [Dubosiella newyorkensis]
MELTEKERELLELYRVHKKKKRQNLLISSLLVLLLSGSLYAGYKYVYEPSKKSVAKMEEQIEKVDRTAPSLILNKESIEIKEGDAIDYLLYISSAEDEKDGDLLDKVKYTSIDTTKSGDQTITYMVTDKAGNKATAALHVSIKKKETNKPKEEPEEKKEEPVEIQQPSVEEPVYVEPQQPAPSIPSTPQPVVPSAPAPVVPQIPENKQFLFSEGYNMENVSGACMAYITGYTGGCYPLQNADGIYYGMEARFE